MPGFQDWTGGMLLRINWFTILKIKTEDEQFLIVDKAELLTRLRQEIEQISSEGVGRKPQVRVVDKPNGTPIPSVYISFIRQAFNDNPETALKASLLYRAMDDNNIQLVGYQAATSAATSLQEIRYADSLDELLNLTRVKFKEIFKVDVKEKEIKTSKPSETFEELKDSFERENPGHTIDKNTRKARRLTEIERMAQFKKLVDMLTPPENEIKRNIRHKPKRRLSSAVRGQPKGKVYTTWKDKIKNLHVQSKPTRQNTYGINPLAEWFRVSPAVVKRWMTKDDFPVPNAYRGDSEGGEIGVKELEVIRQWVEDQGLGNRVIGADAEVTASLNRIMGQRNEEEE